MGVTVMVAFIIIIVASASTLRPVVLVPGLAGSRLQYQFDNVKPGPLCEKSSNGWKDAWVVLESLLPGSADCVMSRLAMKWGSNGTWLNTDRVDVRVVHGLESVEYLDPTNSITKDGTAYYAGLIAALTAVGYTRNVDLIGAPYDWRQGTIRNDLLFEEWKLLIEVAVNKTGLPAVIVSHSMGCVMINYFLNTMTASWKRANVYLWIGAGGPLGGAPQVLEGIISGYDLGITTLPNSDAQLLEGHSGAGMLLSPLPLTSIWGASPLLEIGNSTFYASDLPAFFVSHGYGAPYTAEMTSFPRVLSDPGVPVKWVYGTNIR